MKRAIDTIVHDQADGPVPADTPAPDTAAPTPELEAAADTAAPASTTKRRRAGGEE